MPSQPLIDGRFGWKYNSSVEDNDGVTGKFVDLEGKAHNVKSKYLIGCYGGGNLVRRNPWIRMIGGYL